MINVLSRLAELDAKNSNVAPAKIEPDAAVKAVQQSLSEELSMDSLRYLSGVKETLEECGIMPGMPTSMPTPASFSINASAATGDEVASMLTNIMTLAGMHKVGAEHMPAQEPKAMSMVPPMNGADSMKKMLDVMNEPPEDEGLIGGMLGAAGGAALGGVPGATIGYAAGSKFGDDLEDESAGEMEPAMGGEMEPEMGDDTPDISGVGGALAGAAIHGDAEGAKKGMEDGEDNAHSGNEDIRRMMDAVDNMYDNSGADANAIAGPGKHSTDDNLAYRPNSGSGVGRGSSQQPHGNPHVSEDSVTAKLFDDYKKFTTEGKGKCCCADKGKEKCPVHGKMDEATRIGTVTPARDQYGDKIPGARPTVELPTSQAQRNQLAMQAKANRGAGNLKGAGTQATVPGGPGGADFKIAAVNTNKSYQDGHNSPEVNITPGSKHAGADQQARQKSIDLDMKYGHYEGKNFPAKNNKYKK